MENYYLISEVLAKSSCIEAYFTVLLLIYTYTVILYIVTLY